MASKKQLEQFDTNALLYKLLADRVGAIDPHQVFYANQIQGGKDAGKYVCYLGGKKLTDNQAANLKQEVMIFKKGSLYKLLTETLSHDAKLRMFEKSKTTDDMFFGKAMLYNVSIIDTIIAAIENAHIDTTPAAPTVSKRG